MNQFIGIDIGATKIRAVMLEGLSISKIKPVYAKTPETLEKLHEELSRLLAGFDVSRATGIGFSIAGLIDSGGESIIESPNINFLRGVAKENLCPFFSGLVRIDNDARCFLRAEMAFGAAKGEGDIIGLVFGTGIGAAIWKDGTFYVGDDGRAGELGHELYNGVEFEKLAQDQFQEKGESSDIYGAVIAEALQRFKPAAIVLGGGPIASGAYRISDIKKKAELAHGGMITVDIRMGALGDTAQAIGAALLFHEK